jgi:hypothetical protein
MLLNAVVTLLEMLRNIVGGPSADNDVEEDDDAFDEEAAALASKKRVSSTTGWKGVASTSFTWVCKVVASKLAFVVGRMKRNENK